MEGESHDQQQVGPPTRTEPPMTQAQPPTIVKPPPPRPVPREVEASLVQPLQTPTESSINSLPTQRSGGADRDLVSQKFQQDRICRSTNQRFFPPRSIIIDGSNIAFVESDHKRWDPRRPQMKCIYALLEELENYGIKEKHLQIYFDSNIQHRLSEADQEALVRDIKQGRVLEVAPNTEGDSTLIQCAHRLHRKFVVISNDKFGKKVKWFGDHRVGVGFDFDDKPLLVIESVKDLYNAYHGIKPSERQEQERVPLPS